MCSICVLSVGLFLFSVGRLREGGGSGPFLGTCRELPCFLSSGGALGVPGYSRFRRETSGALLRDDFIKGEFCVDVANSVSLSYMLPLCTESVMVYIQ